MTACRSGGFSLWKRDVITVVLRLTMLGLVWALAMSKGATIGSGLLSNSTKLGEIKLRFEGGGELKSTPADVKRILQRVMAATGVDQPDHWRAAGEIALLNQEWDTAIRAFKRGITLSHDPYALYITLARAQVSVRDWGGAISSYEAAVQLAPKRGIDAYLLAANIELQRGDYRHFAAWCDRARQSFPNSYLADRTHGIGAWQLHQWVEAERLLLSAHQKGPDDPYPLYYLALTKSAQGNFLAAARYMEQATRSFKELPVSVPPPCDWLGIAGDLYRQANDLKGAKSMYEQGLVHCPLEQIFSDRLRAIQAIP